jgi:methyl-accepting chemotaxis protein
VIAVTTAEWESQKNRDQKAGQHGPGHALSILIAKYVALILTGGMAAYACVQYMLMPDVTVMQLAVEHLGHVVFLMLLVYIVLYFVLMKVVVGPIQRFRAKLYRVAGGDLTPISEASRITEMQEMADGINLMIERLAAGLPHTSLADLSTRAAELRELAQRSDNLSLEQKETLLNVAQEMEALVALVTKNAVRTPLNGIQE